MKLLNQEDCQGQRLWVNQFKLIQEKAEYFRPIHRQIWVQQVENMRTLTKQQFAEIFPECTYKADLWDSTRPNAQGKPTQNAKVFWTYVNEHKAKKRQEKRERKANEAQKKRF